MFNLHLFHCCHLPCPLFSTKPTQVGLSLHLYTSGTGPVSSHWTSCCRKYLVIFCLLVFTLCVQIRFISILGKVQPVLLDLIHFWGSHFGVRHFHLSSERLFFKRLAQLQQPLLEWSQVGLWGYLEGRRLKMEKSLHFLSSCNSRKSLHHKVQR